jgi:hypothetical protein
VENGGADDVEEPLDDGGEDGVVEWEMVVRMALKRGRWWCGRR